MFILLIVFFLSIIFSILGIGGASIYVPLFYFFGLEVQQAIVTGLFLNIVSTFISYLICYQNNVLKKQDYKKVFLIFIGIILGAIFGSNLYFFISLELVKIIMAIVLIFSAYQLFNKNKMNGNDNKDYNKNFFSNPGLELLVGMIVGGIAGLVGIGGGIILMPFLLNQKLEIKKAIALSQLCVFFASILSFYAHFFNLQKNLEFDLILLGIAALLGSYFGAKIVIKNKIKKEPIIKIFAILLILFSLKLIFEVLTLDFLK